MKICTSCNLEKSFEEFHKDKKGRFGLRAICKKCAKDKITFWQKTNKEKVSLRDKKWRTQNHLKYLQIQGNYAKTHKPQRNAINAKRRAVLKNAIPKWADLEKIKEFYEKCPPGFHVDHIIPLQNKVVCGLHTIENLQYLPASVNISKGNRLWQT
jgi:superfamily II helicase